MSLNTQEILLKYHSFADGLTSNEALVRQRKYGLNKIEQEEHKTVFSFLFKSFKDKFILILIVLAIINLFLSDVVSFLIILGIAFISAMIRFYEDYHSYLFNQKLKKRIVSKSMVLRNKKETIIPSDHVCVGDIVIINAGSIIPADGTLIYAKGLFLNMAPFTGESRPVEKNSCDSKEKDLINAQNVCLAGSSVVSGYGKLLITSIGKDTYLGGMNKDLASTNKVTSFDRGMQNITALLIKYMLLTSIMVFIIYGFIRKDYLEAFLFSLSVAVGITPSMLPMIVNVNLSKGVRTLETKNTLVKNINAIENLGSMDTLCTDKTGTLTKDNITLMNYVNCLGEDDEDVFKLSYLNSYYGSGVKNLVDHAIMDYAKMNIQVIKDSYTKIDEIPFDYEKRLMSVLLKDDEETILITKGSLENVINVCEYYSLNGEIKKITKDIVDNINEVSKTFEKKGMQVIALAYKKTKEAKETNLVFKGLMAFLDPPKKDVSKTISKLKDLGVTTRVITGDNVYATKTICELCLIDTSNILTGEMVSKMSDDELKKVMDKTYVYARMNPSEKERIVKLYQSLGHTVGYMGDGVNDALSLSTSDVGISVSKATDIAKEKSDIILLVKSLDVILDGVVEGRRVYGNIIKYMKMALSADFGDVFSILIASIFLPFLPLLPIQMLIQDFLFDFSQIMIPYDNVDKEFLSKPRKWSAYGLGRFMNTMGITSSICDAFAFIMFWFVLGYRTPEYFQTAWFIECIISETIIIYFVRTSKSLKASRPSNKLIIGTLITIVGTILTPIVLSNIKSFNFVILPINYYLVILLVTAFYTVLVMAIKKLYIKKYKEWM